jgi:hypothetical protein
LGARHQLTPECRKSPSRPAISLISATRRSQQRSGARHQLRLRSWMQLFDNNSTTSSSSTAAPTAPHSIKPKFSSSKRRLLFYFHRTRHSGAPP